MVTEDSLYKRITRLDTQIRIEFDLVGSRVSWLLISNAFLFSAYILVQDIAVKQNLFKENVVTILIWAIPLLGLVSSILVWGAILAAHNVINHLKAQRDKVEIALSGNYQYERLGISVNKFPHIIGNLPPNILPLFLMSIWICIISATYASSNGFFSKLPY